MSIMENHQVFLDTDFSGMEGQWLAIINKKVVATGKNFKEVITKVNTEYPNEKPLIAKAPSKKALVL